jgi:hypothetical protein
MRGWVGLRAPMRKVRPMPDPPRPRGRAIVRTAEERAQAAEITPMDVQRARMRWHEAAPVGWAGLIEAKAEPEREAT